jgi:peptidyl-prolyl cis-trans isomerase B (cyclophilin B)
MKKLLTLIFTLLFIQAFAAKPKYQYVKITTDKGECIVRLYNETPLHRDNFIKLVKEGYFNGTLFHRVIKDFMIQGGDPDSKNATPDATLGNGGPKYTIPAEFRDSLFHKKGVLAAAREGDDVNPTKASSGSQFYLVQGKVFTDSTLNIVETRRLKFKIPEWQRQVYKTIGGTPHLDRNYTVFGEIVKGLNMVDSIASEVTGKANRPVADVKMTIVLLKKREAKRLEKELAKLV